MATKANVRALRSEYAAAKKLYSKTGKKARGKPKTSAAYKDYRAAKGYYKKVGSALGRATGLRSRR